MTAAVPAPDPGVTVRAPAKINLRLEVGPVRPDGFHPLATVYQAIGIYDDVTVTDQAAWSISVDADPRIDVSAVPLDERNIAWKAGVALAEHHGIDRAAHISIDKHIPVEGGMAGGSADAAATLVALDRLWDLQTSDEDLLEIAGRLGSDVPFALIGGTAFGGGRGELVTPLTDRGAWWWVIVESDLGLSTPAVYREFDRLQEPAEPAETSETLGAVTAWAAHEAGPDDIDQAPAEIVAALASGEADWLGEELANDLTEAALSLRPDLREAVERGKELRADGTLISGSGPTVLHLCGSADEARRLQRELMGRGVMRVSAAPGPVAGATVVELDR